MNDKERIAVLETERDALAIVLQHLRPHAREMYVHIPQKGTVTLGWLMDQAGYREVVAARDERMKRKGALEALRKLRSRIPSCVCNYVDHTPCDSCQYRRYFDEAIDALERRRG